jgi:ribonucleoside-diphosphate reductase alpha chain
MPATKFVSKGLTRGLPQHVFVVRGNTALASEPQPVEVGNFVGALQQSVSTAFAQTDTAVVIREEALTKAKAQIVQVSATLTTEERRREARVKGYEGESCQECGNFTLVRNGTCLKCDTCGGTSGCS